MEDNTQIQETKVESENKQGKTLALLGTVVVLLAIGGVAWFFMQDTFLGLEDANNQEISENTGKVTNENNLPTGRIYMTLLSLDAERKYSVPFIFDIDQDKLLQQSVKRASFIRFPSFSGQYSTFIGSVTYKDDPKNAPWRTSQVYTSSLSDQEDIVQIDQSTRITNGLLTRMRTPSITDDGKRVLFAATDEQEKLFPKFVDDWSIYFASENTEVYKVTNGMYPNWITNESFIYLKNDGVYLYNISTKEEILLLPNGSNARANQMMHLSEDKSTLAWTFPSNGLVFVFRLDFTDSLVLEQIAKINTTAFWPVVSPDGNFLAVQSVNVESIINDPQPVLEFYSLVEKNNPVKLDLSVDLSSFDQEKMFINDWR